MLSITKSETSKAFQLLVSVALLAITGLIIFNAQLGVLKWLTNYSVQIMLGMLALGFIFFVFARERLMFTSLICCSLLCLFLQRSANANLVLPAYSSGAVFKIAHANLANVTGDLEEALNVIRDTKADLISIQEVNFPLQGQVNSHFVRSYPYQTGPMKKNDFWSINVWSQTPIINLDTFYVGDMPNLHGSILIENDAPPIHFISTYVLPPFSDQLGSNDFNAHLEQIGNRRRSMDAPYVVFGDFNVAGWYDEIQDFRERIELMDSRRGYMPAVNSIFSYPVDHIFFSEQLECIGFEVLETPSSGQIGIVGTYQYSAALTSEEQ